MPCSRKTFGHHRPGNKLFRTIVQDHVHTYISARTKLDKSIVLNRIIEVVRSQENQTARIVKYSKETGWFDIGDDQAREKVGHAMREAVCALEAHPIVEPEAQKLFDRKQSALLQMQRKLFQKMVEATLRKHVAVSEL